METVNAQKIHGDLSARIVNGDVTLGEVMGDISLRAVEGDMTIQAGHRDANLREMGGQNKVQQIHGDIRIYGDLVKGVHTFTANGDIILRWPINAPLQLEAKAPHISNRLQLDDVVETENSLTGRIGEGHTAVSLNSNGRITIKDIQVISSEWEQGSDDDFSFDFDFDMEGLAAQIGAQITQKVAIITADLENKFGPDFTQSMADKISRKAEKAAAKAQREAEKAAARAQREAEKAQRRAERQQRRGRRSRPTPPPPSKPKASAEEQMKILHMVEKGVITPEEANTLLEALES